jgi:hypothetical protein
MLLMKNRLDCPTFFENYLIWWENMFRFANDKVGPPRVQDRLHLCTILVFLGSTLTYT